MTINSKIISGIILMTLLATLSGCTLNLTQKNTQPPTAVQNEDTNTQTLEQAYQTNVHEILKAYWQDNRTPGIKDKILNLTVPQKYLDLHFNLVTGLELIEEGVKSGDQTKIFSGTDRINRLKATYPWLQ